MKDERRAWVPVSTYQTRDISPWWSCANVVRTRAIRELLSLTGLASWEQAYRADIRMMRCTVEVPARKGKRR